MQIPYKVLKAVSLFAPVDDVRYYLNGVLIDSTGTDVRLVATNGHVLGLYRLEQEAPAAQAILSIKDVKMLLGTVKRATEKDLPFDVEIRTEEPGGPMITVKHPNGIAVTVRPIEGTFPKYSRVLPTNASGDVAQFNPEYLDLFAQADRVLGELKRPNTPFVYVHHNGAASALVECQHDDAFVGVIMPQAIGPVHKPSEMAAGLT